MNKFILMTALAILPSIAVAGENFEGLRVKLSGKIDSQFGYTNFEKPFNHKVVNDFKSSKYNNSAIVNDTELKIEADAEYNGLKYGGLIKLNADTSESKTGSKDIADKTMIYVESSFGRIEGGSYEGATDAMKVSAASIAVATGGIDGHYGFWLNSHTGLKETGSDHFEHFKHVFVADPYLPIGGEVTGKANKITYYTPSLGGLRFGVSYVPDTESRGTISKANKLTKVNDKDLGYRNVVELALKHEYKFNEVEFEGAVLYQIGRAKSFIADNVNNERNKLNAWEVGALIRYKGLSLAGSYGDWKKSGTIVQKADGQKYGANFWNIGAAYKQDRFGMSLTYLKSKRGSATSFNRDNKAYVENVATDYNKAEVLSLGVDYKIAQGLMTYAEATHFKHKRAGALINNKGEIYLGGIKVSF